MQIDELYGRLIGEKVAFTKQSRARPTPVARQFLKCDDLCGNRSGKVKLRIYQFFYNKYIFPVGLAELNTVYWCTMQPRSLRMAVNSYR